MRSKSLLLSCLLLGGLASVGDAQADCCALDDKSYGLGLGGGVSQLSGDFFVSKRLTSVAMGMEFERDSSYFVWRAITDKDNYASTMQIAIGGGYRYAKLGVGFISQKINSPASVPSGFLAVPDPSRSANVHLSTWPVYLRLHPLLTNSFTITLDGYHGYGSTGTMKIPLYFFSGGDIETLPQRAGGLRGSSVSLQWWPWSRKGASFRLDVRQDEGRMDRAHTTFSKDLGGAFGSVDIPLVQYTTQQALLSILMPL
jgi:hypothetical protein